MSVLWNIVNLVFSFLGKVSIVIMMGGVVLRAPGFTGLGDLWGWIVFHTVCCAVGFAAQVRGQGAPRAAA